jgi:hypothetical protein
MLGFKKGILQNTDNCVLLEFVYIDETQQFFFDGFLSPYQVFKLKSHAFYLGKSMDERLKEGLSAKGSR